MRRILMKFRNFFKHRHDLAGICHCYQLMCSGCTKHLWELIRDSPRKINEKTKEEFFKLNNETWISISVMKNICIDNKFRFYTVELGEVETGWGKRSI